MSKFDIVVPVGGHLVSVMGLARMAVIVIVCFRLIQSVHSWKLLAGSLAQDLLLAAFVLACIYLVALGFTLLTIWLSLVVHRFREYSPRFAWVLALFLTAVGLPLLVGYGWLAVNLASMVNGYRTFVSAGLATWNVPLPVVTVLPSVRAQIGDSVLIAVAIGLAVFGVFLGREVVLSWKRSVRLLGPRAALRSIGMMARILYRQPLRYLYFNAPGFIPLVVFALILLVTWRADSAAAQHLASSVVPVTIAGLVILISTLISLVTMTPPVIAWLSVSGVEEFRTMKNVQKSVPRV